MSRCGLRLKLHGFGLRPSLEPGLLDDHGADIPKIDFIGVKHRVNQFEMQLCIAYCTASVMLYLTHPRYILAYLTMFTYM